MTSLFESLPMYDVISLPVRVQKSSCRKGLLSVPVGLMVKTPCVSENEGTNSPTPSTEMVVRILCRKEPNFFALHPFVKRNIVTNDYN